MSKSNKSSKEENVIYFHKEETNDKDAKNSTTLEKMVRHTSKGFICKYFDRKNDKMYRVSIKSEKPGEYVVSVKDGANEPKTSTHDKKGLIAFLKDRKELDFIAVYVSKENTLL